MDLASLRAPRQGERFDGFQPLQTLENVITWSRVQRGETEQWTESTRDMRSKNAHHTYLSSQQNTSYLHFRRMDLRKVAYVYHIERGSVIFAPHPQSWMHRCLCVFLRHPLYAADPPTRPLSCIIIARGRQAKKPFPSSYAQYTACSAQIKIESSEEHAESAVVCTVQSILSQGRWFMRELQIAYPYRRSELQDVE